MSKMSELVFDIQEDIDAGILSFSAIAEKHSVPLSWVDEIADEYASQVDYDDSMDGDHDSAMASAGWGTDEDYGYMEQD